MISDTKIVIKDNRFYSMRSVNIVCTVIRAVFPTAGSGAEPLKLSPQEDQSPHSEYHAPEHIFSLVGGGYLVSAHIVHADMFFKP